MSELSHDELERYQRHLSLPQFGEAAQVKLKEARVLVIGAGGLGCPALQYLAAAGVGTLGVMDFDTVDRSNLQRQILFNEADVGKIKAEVAAARLRKMNPSIEVLSIAERLNVENAIELFGNFDVIVDGSDNFITRYLVNDACVLAEKPLIYGAIYTFQGQVSVFNFKGGPTYRCLFAEPPDPKDALSCSEIGVVGVLPGLIGTLQATETIKVITGVGEPLSGSLLMWDVLTMKQQMIRFSRNPVASAVTELKEIDYACEVENETSGPLEIEVAEFCDWIADGRPLQVLDVREDWERAMARIDSVHIPLGEFVNGTADPFSAGLKTDVPTVVYCASGVRSLRAADILMNNHEFHSVWSLSGGINAWAQSGELVIFS